MSKYMLIMRNSGSAEDLKDRDFKDVTNAMGAYNEAMMEAGSCCAGTALPTQTRGPSSNLPMDTP